MMDRDRFKNLRHAVPAEMFDSHTIAMLSWFELYFNQHPEHTKIDPDGLFTLMKLRANLDKDALAITASIIAQLSTPIDKQSLDGVVNSLEEVAFAGKAGAILSKYNNGDDIDLTFELMLLSQESRRRMQGIGQASWADGDIKDYLDAEKDEGGLVLDFIPALGRRVIGLRGGDNIAVVAPTDKGKTSFLIKMAACFAHQAKDMPQYANRPLLYLVNEGQAERLVPRMYQTACALTREQTHHLSNTGELTPLYIKHVGRRDAIRFVNIHGMSTSQVARIIESHKPYCVITDMTGRIRSASNKGGMNDISQLEDVWNTMREMAAIFDFIHVGTVQVSAEGFDMLYPPLSAMQNSKTGIQTTLDLCIMMGALQAPECANLRGISTPKNKRARAGMSNRNEIEVVFDGDKNAWHSPDAASLPQATK